MFCIILVLSNCVWSVCCTLDYWVSTERCWEMVVFTVSLLQHLGAGHTLAMREQWLHQQCQDVSQCHIHCQPLSLAPLIQHRRSLYHIKSKLKHDCLIHCSGHSTWNKKDFDIVNATRMLNWYHPYQCSRARYWWNGNKSLIILYQGYWCLWEENRICLIEAAENCKFID